MSHPTRFDGSNLIMRAPAGAENVQDMHVFQTRHSCVSCWTVAGDELAEINATGKIFLSVLMGGQQPPVYVGSESTCRAVMVDFGPVWPMAPRPTTPSPSTHMRAVPHEPTPEMIAAAMRADQDGGSASMKTIWMVMWGAYQPPQTKLIGLNALASGAST